MCDRVINSAFNGERIGRGQYEPNFLFSLLCPKIGQFQQIIPDIGTLKNYIFSSCGHPSSPILAKCGLSDRTH